MVFDFDEIPNGFLAALKYKTQKISTKNDTVNDTVKRIDLIIEEFKKNPHVSYEELSRLIKKSRKTVYRDIEKMKKLGLIKRVGADKKGYWKVLNSSPSNNSL